MVKQNKCAIALACFGLLNLEDNRIEQEEVGIEEEMGGLEDIFNLEECYRCKIQLISLYFNFMFFCYRDI